MGVPEISRKYPGAARQSDFFPPSFIAVVLAWDSRRGPGRQGQANNGTFRIPRKVFQCMGGACGHAGPGRVSRY